VEAAAVLEDADREAGDALGDKCPEGDADDEEDEVGASVGPPTSDDRVHDDQDQSARDRAKDRVDQERNRVRPVA
jgi:hypothetical protein